MLSRRNFTFGDTVIVDESKPRNVWPIGRITEVFPDKDGFLRCVRIKTKTSTLERPITKLCLLESIEHRNCLVFPDLFKRLCVTFPDLT